MTCPKCGSPRLAEQKFCRSCGASLPVTTQPLAEAPSLTKLENKSAIGFRSEERRANSFVFWGVIIMFIGAAIGVIGKKLVHEDIITVVGVLISFAGMFLTVYPYLAPSSRKKTGTSSSLQPDVLTLSEQPRYLPRANDIEYVSSITERTTDLLKNSVATGVRQRQKEDALHKSERTEEP